MSGSEDATVNNDNDDNINDDKNKQHFIVFCSLQITQIYSSLWSLWHLWHYYSYFKAEKTISEHWTDRPKNIWLICHIESRIFTAKSETLSTQDGLWGRLFLFLCVAPLPCWFIAAAFPSLWLQLQAHPLPQLPLSPRPSSTPVPAHSELRAAMNSSSDWRKERQGAPGRSCGKLLLLVPESFTIPYWFPPPWP